MGTTLSAPKHSEKRPAPRGGGDRAADAAADTGRSTALPLYSHDLPPPLALREELDETSAAAPPSASETGGDGEPLAEPTRGLMESRFGEDFGGVRVHTGPRADAASSALDADAYAVGSDLVFAEGLYAPGTERGDALIAHELTHVVQQSGDARLDRSPRDPEAEGEDGAEAEAARNAEAVTRGRSAEVRHSATGSTLPQRQRPGGRTARPLTPSWTPGILGAPFAIPPTTPTPYMARTITPNASIFSSPPPLPSALGGVGTPPRRVFNLGDRVHAFVTVTEDTGGAWVRVRHGASDGWMRRGEIEPVTDVTPQAVERSVMERVAVSESGGRPGFYSTEDNRDNIGMGSWTCGTIVLLMNRYERFFRGRRERARLEAFFTDPRRPGRGGMENFNEIRGRFTPAQFPGCSQRGGIRLDGVEADMFRNAGRDPLARRAQEDLLHADFNHYRSGLGGLRDIYPFVAADDTISELAMAMIASMRHRGEPDWRGTFRQLTVEYNSNPGRFPAGEPDYLREAGRRLAQGRVSIQNRYFNVVSAFRESTRRFPLSAVPAAAGGTTSTAPTTTPNSAPPRR